MRFILYAFSFTMLLFTACTFSGNENSGSATKTDSSQQSASPEIQPKDPINQLVAQVERAHHKAVFKQKPAIQFNISLVMGGKQRLKGKMILNTRSTQGRIELEGGEIMIYQYDKVFYSPRLGEEAKVRFDAYTWSYFFLFPYKLSDPGTVWSPYERDSLNGKPYDTQKLTFENGTGDTPDDWYILYADPKVHLTGVVAYIVTSNKSQEEAEEDPHAIKYENYQQVDGIPIATQWTFWRWRKDEGLTEQLGEATISNIKFVEPTPDTFKPTSDLVESTRNNNTEG